MTSQWATLRRPAVRTVNCTCCPQLVGTRRGSLTVLGPTREHNRGSAVSKTPRWVVKCDCGAYDFRHRRPLVGRENLDDKCGFCQAHEAEFKTQFHEKHGRYPDYFEIPKRLATTGPHYALGAT